MSTPKTVGAPAPVGPADDSWFVNPFVADTIKNVAVETVLQGVTQKMMGTFSARDSLEFVGYDLLYESFLARPVSSFIAKTNTDANTMNDVLEARVLKFLGISLMDIIVGNMMLKAREGYSHIFIKNAITQAGAAFVGYVMEGKK